MSRDSTENADIYVIRINTEGESRNSMPCPMCQEAMRFVGIKRVFYSSENGTFEMMKL
jgi:deoxycytidylate deaminase